MEKTQTCLACGATWDTGQTCEDAFHQMLAWEWEYPDYWSVHHLMVASYHLQHPHLYSPEALQGAMHMLEDFVERGVTPQQMRQRQRAIVDSGNRTWKIKGTPSSHGSYTQPVQWTMTAPDVIARDAENYCESVRLWAQAILTDLKRSGNLISW